MVGRNLTWEVGTPPIRHLTRRFLRFRDGGSTLVRSKTIGNNGSIPTMSIRWIPQSIFAMGVYANLEERANLKFAGIVAGSTPATPTKEKEGQL